MGKLRKAIASLSMVAVLSTLVVSTTAFAAYKDVPTTHWAYPFVSQLEVAEVLTKADNFYPDKEIERAEVGKMAVLGFGLAGTSLCSDKFEDCVKGQWYDSPLGIANDNGVVKGDGNTGLMRPAGKANRAEAMVVVWRAAGEPAPAKKGSVVFPKEDPKSPIPSWADDAIGWGNCNLDVNGYTDGTFGSNKNITRAEFAKLLVGAMDPGETKASCLADTDTDADTDADTDTDTDTDTPADTPAVEAPGGSFTASISKSTPTVTTLADGTAFNDVLAIDFAGGSTASEITGFTLDRTGLSSDSYVKVSVWDESGARHGSVVTFSEGKAEVGFSSDPIIVPANDTQTVMFKVNLDANLGSATVAVSINSVDDVETNGELTGSFPLSSPTFGTVDGSSSVAAGTFDVVNLSTTTRNVDIGQKEYELTKFKIVETSSKEDLIFTDLVLFNNGTAADGDLVNFQLKDQAGELVASAEGQESKKISLTFEGDYVDGYTVPKGTTRYFSLYVDIKSGASRTAQSIVQNDYDVELKGATTKASILATADAAGVDTSFPIGDRTTTQTGYNHITLNEGTLSIAKDGASPSGDVTIGSSEVTLGIFKVEAQGEDVELQKVAVDLSGTSGATTGSHTGGTLNATNTTTYFDCAAAASCDLTGSVKVVTSGGKTLVTVTASTAALWNGTPAYVDLSAYHTVKAGESETLSVVGNIQSSTTYIGEGETLTAGINKVYYYKKSSLKYADSGSAAANSISATTSSLTVSKNTAYGDQTVVSGTSKVKLASFIIKAGSAEDVSISSIAFLIDESVVTSGNINASNVKFYKYVDGGDGDVQLGTTQATVTDNTSTTLSVSGLKVLKSEQVQIDVYADTSSNLSTHTLTTSIAASGVSGNGTISQSNPTGPSAVLPLQVITGATSGTLTVVAANDNPVAAQWVAGTSANDALKIKLTASQAEDIYIKEVTIYNDTNADDVAVSSLTLYDGDINKGTLSLQQNTTYPGYTTWSFSGINRPKVPKNGTSYLTVKANLVSSQQGTVTNLTPRLALSHMKAEGYAAVTPVIVAAQADSGANLLADAGNVAVTDGAACDATVADATTTTVTIGTCTAGNVPTLLPVGTLIYTGTEAMLVTATASGSITVTRGANSTTAAAHTASAVNYYGKLIASAANTIVPIDAIENLQGYVAADCVGSAAMTLVAGAGECKGAIGQIVSVGTEQMYVHSAARSTSAAHDLLYVVRGVNGTTIAASAGGVNLNEITSGTGKVAANESYVSDTKLAVAAGASSPQGSTSASTGMIVAEFVVSADNNTADVAENSISLDNLDLTFNRSSVTLSNVKVYPKDKDLDATYSVAPSMWVSGSVARFNVGGDTDWTTGGYDKVVEGASRTYVVRADVTNATNGSLQVKFGNLGTAGATSLGTTTSGGDVQWNDKGDGTGTTFYWVKQTTTEVPLNAATMTFAAASGTHDSTRPTITSFVVTDATADNAFTIDGTIVITFSEAMDPATMGMTVGAATTYLTPGTAATPDNGTKFDFFFDDDDGDDCIAGSTNDALVVIGLACISLGVTDNVATDVAGAGTVTLSAVDDTTDTQTLTIVATAASATPNTGNDVASAAGSILAVAQSGTTGLKDLQGNFLNSTAIVTNTAPADF